MANKVLLLDRKTWDLCLASGGVIAVAADPYATSQAVSCALKLWQGDYWYDTTIGVPYQQILGGNLPLQTIKSQLEAAALTVPGVLTATCYISSFVGRNLTGQVQFTTASGNGSVSL